MRLKVPMTELESRMNAFRSRMEVINPQWEMAIIFSKINQYYFTGTMQEGILVIPRNDEAAYWVRRSIERAVDESLFTDIKTMNSFRDVAEVIKTIPETVYLETEFVSLALYQRLIKYFPFKEVRSMDAVISFIRSIKSPYELSLMEQSGKIHARVLEDLLPGLLEEEISEADLAGKLYRLMVKEGHHGVARFRMFDTEMALGHIGFGESSIYPTYFNGPGGNYGVSAAVPLLGSRERKLKKGDLVFVDVGCGFEGYHTDKTMTYMYGQALPEDAIMAHQQCVAIQNRIAARLKPGAIPSQIYKDILESLSPEFLNNFMGFGSRRVKFLGHGIGLQIDEVPVIAEGFDEPLQEGMVLAIEPKTGIAGIGMVGIENTFLVTPDGGRCITGSSPGLISV